MLRLNLVFYCFVVLFGVGSLWAGEWELIKDHEDDDGWVKMYHRDVQDNVTEEFRVVMYSKSVSFDTVVDVVKDYKSYHKWYGMCEELSLLKYINSHHYNMYYVIDTPPLIREMDTVVSIKTKYSMKAKTASVDIHSIKSNHNPHPKLVHLKLAKASFRSWMENGHVKTSYQALIDVGDNSLIPKIFIKQAMKRQHWLTGKQLKVFSMGLEKNKRLKKSASVKKAKK